MIATVFGDVHDIGKSLVNTILTNNGYTVVDLGKQVPISTILDAAEEHRRRPRSASPPCSSRPRSRCRCASRSCTSAGCRYPVLIGGAAINRDFGLRILYPHGREDDAVYEPGVFYCKDAFEGLAKMDQLVDEEARAALVAKTREAAQNAAREAGRRRRRPADDRQLRALRRAHRRARAGAAVVGRARGRGPLDEVYPHLDTHVLFKLHWGGRGVKGDAWRSSSTRTSSRASSACGASRATCTRARSSATSRPLGEGNEVVVFDPEDHDREIAGSCSRASRATTASASPTSTARSTAASRTSSRSRPSPPATRSPS